MKTSAVRLRSLVSPAILLAFTASVAVPASPQALKDSSQPPRITHTVDESSLVTLRGNTPPLVQSKLAQSKFDQGPAPASLPAPRMLLVLTRSTQQEADLQTYLQSVQNVDSPSYRKFLSPDEFGARFGVSDADLQSIQTWLTSHGFTVNKVSRGRTAIEFSGTLGQLQSAFHTSIHSYLINGVSHWSNTTDPQIPTALAPVVAGLASLNSIRPKAHFIRGPSGFYDAAKHTMTPSYTNGDATNGYTMFLGPADVATIYDTPTTLNATPPSTTYTGTGVTIGIAGDSNVDITQNANYRSTFGLAANPLTVVVDGTDPGENGDAIEAYLDTEVANGIAPAANVILYTAADTTLNAGLFLAIQRALDDNQADILNVSFGGCEAVQGTSGNQYVQNLWQQAAAQGITVTVSTGDGGSAGCDDPDSEYVADLGLAVNGLGSTPYNIAVGGTDYDVLYSNFPSSFTKYVDLSNTLPNHRSALSYIPEEPWNNSTGVNTNVAANKPLSYYFGSADYDNIVGGGGGISTVYPVPSWQSTFATGTGRNLPDVSFLAANGFYGALWGLCTDMDEDSNGNPITDCAAPTTGNNFNLTGVGGTSASAPAFAGMLALLKQKTGARLGQADYALYQLAKSNYATVFHDVTTGDNSVNCQSGTPNCSVNAAGFDFLTGYNAATGYDQASGLGSVDIGKLVSDWASVTFTPTTSSLKLNGGTAALNITHGQSVSVSDSVTGTSGTPTGNIALVDSLSPANNPNNEGIAGFTLASGSATGTTTALPGGSYNVSAHYGGSSTFGQSDSNSIPVTVSAESSTTTLTVAGIYDPATFNQVSTPYYGFIYLIDAQPYGNSATAANPNGAATGTITFKSGTTTLGTAPLASDGIAELQTVALPGGNDSLTAAFPGDASFKASTSAPVPFTVVPAVTTLTSSTPANAVAGSSLSFTVSLSADSAGIAPTGTVNLTNNLSIIGSASLVGTAATSTAPASGTATISPSTFLPYGNYSIVPVYTGDPNYASSTAPAVSIIVFPMSSSLVIIPPSSATPTNKPVPVTVNITPAESNGLPAPTGTVTLSFNGQTSPPVTVAGSSATITIPANTLPIGSTTVTANYSGDKYYSPQSTTGPVNTKSSGTLSPNVTVTAPTTTVSYPVTVKVSAGTSGNPTATGSVSITNGAKYGSSATLTNGVATFTITSGLTSGANTLTATYLGDSNYTSGTGTATVAIASASSISFTPSSPSIVVNQSLPVTITVATATGLAAPTGTITLSSGTYTSTATQLAAGSAAITIPANSLAVGTDTLTATYSGDVNYLAATATETVTAAAPPPPGLKIAALPLTVTPGSTTGNTVAVTVTPSNGFTGSVALTATLASSPSGAQDLPTLSFGSTSPVSITGTTAGTATLTITTTAPSTTAFAHPALPGIRWYQGGAALACLLLFGIPARRRRLRTLLGMFAFLTFLTTGLISCGGGGGGGGGGTGPTNPGTTPGAYVISVTGTQGAVTATTNVTLTVQ